MTTTPPPVGVYVDTFLHRTHTGIHRTVQALQRHQPLVACRRRRYPEQFPFEGTMAVLGEPRRSRAPWARIARVIRADLPENTRRQRLALDAFYREHSAQLIHAHSGLAGIFLAPVARRLRVPLVVSFRGADSSSWLRVRRYRRAIRRVMGMEWVTGLVPSEFMRRRLVAVGVAARALQQIAPGVPLPPETPRPAGAASDPFRVLFVGNLVPRRGAGDALQALVELRAAVSGARLTLVGEGPEAEGLRERIQEEGLQEVVQMTGFLPREKLETALAEADVLVHPSLTGPDGGTEGAPLTVLEGMAAGLPVVATRHAAIPEVVEHEVTGLLVPEGRPELLAGALSDLARDRERACAMGAAGRKVVQERYLLDRAVGDLEDLFARTLSP